MLLFSALFAAALAGEDPMATHATVHVLPNGLTVVLEEDHRSDSVALHIKYGVGSRDERDGEHGCAHLFEHLMFEGSANVPNNAFDEWLTAAGGWNNAFTSEDETAYHMMFPSGALDRALFLESDRLGFLDSGLDQTNLDNQSLVVLQERAESYSSPHGRDFDAINRLLFPAGHPYHVPVIGTVADVEGFSLDGVRSFWGRHYRTRNAVLALVGHFDSAEALARIEHWFSDVPDRGEAEARSTGDDAPTVPSNGLIEDDVEDRTLYLVYRSVPMGHPDEPALDLLSWILSGGPGTRIDDRLYFDTNLALESGAMSWSSEIDGAFILYASSPKTPLARLDKEIGKQLASIIEHPPTAAEIERARRSLRSGTLDTLDALDSRAEALADCQALRGDANCTATDWARYEAVTADDIVRAARTWLVPARRITLSVVPRGDRGALRGAAPVELP